ncbi:Receptor expression-enhancing protein 5 [Globodera pallida]|nr:Receptor expression-enhancing protein 5 [Globodera pallida]
MDEQSALMGEDGQLVTSESSAIEEVTTDSTSTTTVDGQSVTSESSAISVTGEVSETDRQDEHVTRPEPMGVVESQLQRHQVPINSFVDIRPVLLGALARLKHPMIKQIEEKTGIGREKLFYITATFIVIFLLFVPWAESILNLLVILWPIRKSLTALHTGNETDQWKLFWCYFALLKLGDTISTVFVGFFLDPLHYWILTMLIILLPKRVCVLLKTMFLLYLELPATYGAINLYVGYVAPKLDNAIGLATWVYEWILWMFDGALFSFIS